MPHHKSSTAGCLSANPSHGFTMTTYLTVDQQRQSTVSIALLISWLSEKAQSRQEQIRTGTRMKHEKIVQRSLQLSLSSAVELSATPSTSTDKAFASRLCDDVPLLLPLP